MSKIILVAETGSDLPQETAKQYGIYLVPMHVAMGTRTLDDGTFPPEDICSYYEKTGTLPKTSGSSPEDFAKVFEAIHREHPDAHILHLAYSAATTVSYQSALLAAEGLDYVTSIDTKHVSVGQGAIVLSVARQLAGLPEVSPLVAAQIARDCCKRARMCFVPDDLEYLRAGGRISNVVYFLGGQLLHLHPRVEVLDGKLIATKKYRGKLTTVVEKLIREYSDENRLSREHLWLLYTTGLQEDVREAAENTAKACGFREVSWWKANGVITTHGRSGAIAVAGFAE